MNVKMRKVLTIPLKYIIKNKRRVGSVALKTVSHEKRSNLGNVSDERKLQSMTTKGSM